jgi:hypothetical protein
LKPFNKLAGRVLLGLKPFALRARGFKRSQEIFCWSPVIFLGEIFRAKGNIFVFFGQSTEICYELQRTRPEKLSLKSCQ